MAVGEGFFLHTEGLISVRVAAFQARSYQAQVSFRSFTWSASAARKIILLVLVRKIVLVNCSHLKLPEVGSDRLHSTVN